MYSQTDIIKQINNYMLKKAEYKELIFVSIDQQKMYHIHSDKIYKSYNISSSKFGLVFFSFKIGGLLNSNSL